MIIRGSEKLRGVHPDLVRVVQRAARDADMVITEGVRTVQRQAELVAAGKSRTMNSRHIPAKDGNGHAVDIYPVIAGRAIIHWNDDPRGAPAADRKANGPFTRLRRAMTAAARTEGVQIEWGGDWKGFPDGPHYQLPWAAYPGDGAAPEVEKAPRIVKGGVEGVNPKPLKESRVIAGSVVAGSGGAAMTAEAVMEATKALQEAESHLSAGTVIGIVVGVGVVVGAGWAIYARWRDGGGLFPWEKA